ncbi:MAG: response regulator [Gammaproteobacteria bacterium]|nr:response regulator [Gammaproteobacteria bacterium]MBU1654273.1 response regulator [Gammaproteobacteria bacterium]MBU1960644.1 response regulator [Gammaproteobacteria bacterium]
MSTLVPPLILVVDDDLSLCDLLQAYLTDNGFRVVAAVDAETMRNAFAQEVPGVVVLDLMLPGEDGLSLARDLRSRSDVPILILSARGDEIDRIVGLEVGADDYLPKPFNPRELLARLRALLRRSHPVAAEQRSLVAFGPFVLDMAGHRLIRDGIEVKLTGAEFDLLKLFVERPNRVLSRDLLIDQLKGFDRAPFDRSIDIRVTRLRRKVEDDPSAPVFIRTVRGGGYLFNPKGAAV